MTDSDLQPKAQRQQKKMQYDMMSAIFLYGGGISALISFPLFLLFVLDTVTDDGTHLFENLKWLLGAGLASAVCISMIQAGQSFYTGEKRPRSVAISYLGLGALSLMAAAFAFFSPAPDISRNAIVAIPFMLVLGVAMVTKGWLMLFAIHIPLGGQSAVVDTSAPTFAAQQPLAQIEKIMSTLPEPVAAQMPSRLIARDQLLLFATANGICVLSVVAIFALAWLTRDW